MNMYEKIRWIEHGFNLFEHVLNWLEHNLKLIQHRLKLSEHGLKCSGTHHRIVSRLTSWVPSSQYGSLKFGLSRSRNLFTVCPEALWRGHPQPEQIASKNGHPP